jgi:hypothetical protein
MELQFSRSGGFAGPATEIGGTVVFSEGGATILAEGSRYRRELAAEEAARLRQAAERAKGAPVSTGPGDLRDAYQYEVRIGPIDGKTTVLTSHGETYAPQAEVLMRWVQEECNRIWDFRIHQSP